MFSNYKPLQGQEKAEFRNKINRLMWENIDLFFLELQTLSEEEIKREVISVELKEWWQEFNAVIQKWPSDKLPKDD